MANNDFQKVIDKLTRIEKFLNKDAAHIIGQEAVNHFRQSFDDEGFTDVSLVKWKPSKRKNAQSVWYGFDYRARSVAPENHARRWKAKQPYKARKKNPITNFSPAATKWKTLKGRTGDLRESIEYTVKSKFDVLVHSKLPYSKIQNQGGQIKVFGKKTVFLPARQFLGKSIKLKARIKFEINKEIRAILNT